MTLVIEYKDGTSYVTTSYRGMKKNGERPITIWYSPDTTSNELYDLLIPSVHPMYGKVVPMVKELHAEWMI